LGTRIKRKKNRPSSERQSSENLLQDPPATSGVPYAETNVPLLGRLVGALFSAPLLMFWCDISVIGLTAQDHKSNLPRLAAGRATSAHLRAVRCPSR